MTKRHKVFISYHHENDEHYRKRFEKLCTGQGSIMDSRSVKEGGINLWESDARINQIIREDYLSDSNVTVVLIGDDTWKRMYVDWEISASIRRTEANPRSGLLGILLPTRKDYQKGDDWDRYTIPPRFMDNIEDPKYASLYDWSGNADEVQGWIDAAYKMRLRKDINPDNSRKLFKHNIWQWPFSKSF